MGVFFHILSTGAGTGASRITRYIAEREKDLTREGPGARPLFSADRENLTYRKADWILDSYDGHPEKSELIHFSVMVTEQNFDKLGDDEKQRQARFREVVREGMQGMAAELNVEALTWVAGIHHHSEHPHGHIVFNKNVIESGTERPGRIARIPKNLLPHKETREGKEVIVPGPIGERFVKALEKHQTIHLSKNKQLTLSPTQRWEQVFRKHQQSRQQPEKSHAPGEHERSTGHAGAYESSGTSSATTLDLWQVARTWRADADLPDDPTHPLRLALGKRLTLEFRLAFAEAWYERAIRHGTTYRFEVIDQSLRDERKISELDVRRRAAARAARISNGDNNRRNEALDLDLTRHSETLKELAYARETKIAALEKDVNSLQGNLATIERNIAKRYQIPEGGRMIPLVSRDVLSELQKQAIKLNMADRVAELEPLRIDLAHEHGALSRNDSEAASLVAQLSVTRADLMAKDTRLQNFEASVHLTTYEVGDERWSLAALDKQISRRREDSKLIPRRAVRLDLRSLARLNYSAADRERAAADVQHLTAVREQIVQRIEDRRTPLVADRDLARDMVVVLENAYRSERHARRQNGLSMPAAKYERPHILSLEASAEVLRDPKLLRDVHEWEKSASKTDPQINWEGRAAAREITSRVAVEERTERLNHFFESTKVASLHIGEHRTATLREVEARTVTEYIMRKLTETQEQRIYRQDVKLAAHEHHDRLIKDRESAKQYHLVAHELASEAKNRNPQFNDKEKMNLEIYAERQNDEWERERYLSLARDQGSSQDREISLPFGRDH
jgi:hypothetical protein